MILKIMSLTKGDEVMVAETKEELKIAATKFAKELLGGRAGFAIKGEERKFIRTFDPEADVIIVGPFLVGG